LLAVLCALGIALGFVQSSARKRNAVDPFSSSVRTLVLPITASAGFLLARTENFSNAFVKGRDLAAENALLRTQLNNLALYQDRVDMLQSEVNNLRILGGFKPIQGRERISASVLAYLPTEQTAILSVGKNRGVELGLPVIAPTGLLGTVSAVEWNRCTVTLLTNQDTDKHLKLGAIDISRKPIQGGLLENQWVTFMDPQAPVEVGDTLVTSGYSEKIPRGIIIGKIISVEDSSQWGARRALLDFAVAPGAAREVQVLR
jgi:rod shape-determining protein MreC